MPAEPFLTKTKEFELVEQWQKKQNPKAVEELLKKHERLVIKIARGYSGYGLPLSDLIAEGHIGIMQALRNFDPQKNLRFSTYAVFWIRSMMLDFILKMASIVRIARSAAQKKLFFRLRQSQFELQQHLKEFINDETIDLIAKKLNVTREEVMHMHGRLSPDISLNSPISTDRGSGAQFQDIMEHKDNLELDYLQQYEMRRKKTCIKKALERLSTREKDIIIKRRLQPKATSLNNLAKEHNLSIERVRQIEHASLKKLKEDIQNIQELHFDNM